MATVGEAAAERDTAVVLFVDALQYVAEEQLAALIMALHDAGQARLPISMVAAGLPQLVGRTGRAKSYAERLFEFVIIDRLDAAAAKAALCVPAERRVSASPTAQSTSSRPYTRVPLFSARVGEAQLECRRRLPDR